jgi:U11/U12 small nuclear ribonucleoprotein SNRNP31
MYQRVTIVKDRTTRESRGIAFVLFLKPEDAVKCVGEHDGVEVKDKGL